MTGAVQRVTDISTKYALEREAFGRTISKFQAIQHQLASLAAHTAQATMATETAFRAADRGDARFEIAVAKIIAGQTATQAAETGHQVHAAIGFPYEHMLNFLPAAFGAGVPNMAPIANGQKNLGAAPQDVERKCFGVILLSSRCNDYRII